MTVDFIKKVYLEHLNMDNVVFEPVHVSFNMNLANWSQQRLVPVVIIYAIQV